MCPNTSRFYGRVAKLQKLSPILESGSCYLFRVRKRDSNFFAASIGLRIETTDFYLIRARKMAQLVGLESISNRGLRGLLLNLGLLFSLHSRVPTNEGLPELVIEYLRPDLE